jgi:hypothetical protein
MKEFVLILLFGKTVLLTPAPIDLFGDVQLGPEKPLSAITDGAIIEIDVSSMIKIRAQEGLLDFVARVKRDFPAGTIEAKLISANGQIVRLRNTDSFAMGKDRVMLDLSAEGGVVPTDVKFDKVIVSSSIRLKSVKVMWRNYTK